MATQCLAAHLQSLQPVVDQVCLDWDAYWGCLTHALVTEDEEVMGLCLGESLPTPGDAVSGGAVRLEILAFLPLLRVDKRKDRVEIEAGHLVEATHTAEQLAAKLGREVRVVGWYHSHPHITALPSHVDLNTQLNLQLLADSFVGLIFATFSGQERGQRCQALCFQNWRGACAYIPMRVRQRPALDCDAAAAHNAASVANLPRLLMEEEKRAFDQLAPAAAAELGPACAYSLNVGSIIERLVWPLIQVARDREAAAAT